MYTEKFFVYVMCVYRLQHSLICSFVEEMAEEGRTITLRRNTHDYKYLVKVSIISSSDGDKLLFEFLPSRRTVNSLQYRRRKLADKEARLRSSAAAGNDVGAATAELQVDCYEFYRICGDKHFEMWNFPEGM